MDATRPARMLVIGLDCATPQFVFGPDRFDLPNLQGLMARGVWGRIRSCDPPITVPAWASMLSSRDPGVLGCYGFRNRRDHSYANMATANATAICEPRVWDILSRAGKKVVVVGVPQTYPPKPVNGWLVSGFLAPDTSADYTYPKALKRELHENVGEFMLDVKDFRTDDKGSLLRRVYDLLDNRFATVKYLLGSRDWDFAMFVEMGVDRLHHGFWRYCDKTHPKYEAGNSYEHVIRDYYQALDRHIGALLAQVGEGTAVMVVSDHGARAMLGGICINEWLMQQGWLTLKERPASPTRIEDCTIDWSRTKAWASGGYYGRVFLNVEGREPEGVVPQAEYEAFRDKMVAAIEDMRDPSGAPLGNRAVRPRDLYQTVNGIAPDLFVYFGGLGWRSVGTVGWESIYTFENDTGPDDANHDFEGIFICSGGGLDHGRELDGLQLMDVAPTILRHFAVDVPDAMQGRVIQ